MVRRRASLWTTSRICLRRLKEFKVRLPISFRLLLSRFPPPLKLQSYWHLHTLEKGGHVRNKRVNGVLAVSRALGDGSLHPVVSAEPYIAVTQLDPSSSSPELLILACDGVWDVMSDQDAANLLQPLGADATAAASLLKDRAFALNSTGTETKLRHQSLINC